MDWKAAAAVRAANPDKTIQVRPPVSGRYDPEWVDIPADEPIDGEFPELEYRVKESVSASEAEALRQVDEE